MSTKKKYKSLTTDSETNLRTVIFKASYWAYEESEDDKLVFYIGGLTREEKTVLIRVDNFTPFIYLELPRRKKWDKKKCKILFDYFTKAMNSNAPIHYSLYKRFLHLHKKPILSMLLLFTTEKATKSFANFFRRKITVENIGSFSQNEFKVHEHNIDPIIKYCTTKNILLAGWLEAKEYIPEEEDGLDEDERKFTTADIDMFCDRNDIRAITDIPDSVIVRHKYMAFDGEMYSMNKNSKLPDPKEPQNVIFHIGTVCGRIGCKKEERTKFLFTLFDCNPIDNTKIIKCKSESDLIIKFAKHVRDKDPDLIPEYNGLKFDWNYILERCELLGIFTEVASLLGRIIGKKALVKKINWSSKAYGEQSFRYFDIHGRIHVDVLIEIERSYKLPLYGLNPVSEHFLGSKKDDITPYQLFMFYDIVFIVGEMLSMNFRQKTGVFTKTLTKVELLEVREKLRELMPIRKCTGPALELRKRFMRAKTQKEYIHLVLECFQLTGKYCIQDTDLTIDLVEKLSLIPSMEEMTNVVHIPMSYLHTRGQQIKVLSQVYREAVKEDIIIKYNDKGNKVRTIDDKYQGATVIEANAGDYKNVGCTDFASLYPTIIITFNISYDSLIEDNDPIPDSECNVLCFSDHVGCGHDPKKRKRKKEDIMCRENKFRFRKVKFNLDGTFEGEGLLPRIERNLLAARKVAKKEMNKFQARYDMHRGKATEDEIKDYKKWGYEIIEKGSLSEKEVFILVVCITTLNARQLSLKISANSAYGATGVQNGFIPCIPCAASVTGMGRNLIEAAIKYSLVKCKNDGISLVYGDTDSSMFTFKDKTATETYDICIKLAKDVSHYLKTKIMEIEEDYSCELPENCKSNPSPIIVEIKTDKTTKKSEKAKTIRVRLDKINKDDLCYLFDRDKLLWYQYQYIPLSLEFETIYIRYILLTMKRYIAYSGNRDGDILKTVKKGVVDARRDNSKFLRDWYKSIYTAILDEKSEEVVINIIYDKVNALFTMQIPEVNLIVTLGVKSIKDYAKKKDSKQAFSESNPYLDCNKNPFIDPVGNDDPRFTFNNIPQVLLLLKMRDRGEIVPPNTRIEIIYLENEEAEHQGDKAEEYNYYKENKSECHRPDLFYYLEKTNALVEILGVKYKHPEIPCIKPEEEFKNNLLNVSGLLQTNINNCKTYSKTVEGRKGKTYQFKKVEAQVTFIIDQFKKKSGSFATKIDITKDSHNKLVECSYRLKSVLVLDRYSKQCKGKRKAWKLYRKAKPTIIKDGSVMEDLLKYRRFFRAVVDEIKDREIERVKKIKEKKKK